MLWDELVTSIRLGVTHDAHGLSLDSRAPMGK